MSRIAPLAALLLALAACSDPTSTPPPAPDAAALDAATPDAPSPDVVEARDAAIDLGDASQADAPDARDVSDASDARVAPDAAGARDAAVDAPSDAGTWSGSDEILGTLRGMCGTIRGMLHSPTPSLLRDDLTFVASERYERAALSAGGQRLYDTANAGGSSSESEVMAFEVLHYCEGASLLRTETEIRYAPPDDSGPNSITDILVEVGGERVGVSVTRAYLPRPMVFTDAAARDLLVRKLQGINRSSMRVLPEDRWVKQILHVLAVDAASADAVARAWATIDAPTRADTIVVVTVTQGGGFIYCNPDPPLGSECPPIGG